MKTLNLLLVTSFSIGSATVAFADAGPAPSAAELHEKMTQSCGSDPEKADGNPILSQACRSAAYGYKQLLAQQKITAAWDKVLSECKPSCEGPIGNVPDLVCAVISPCEIDAAKVVEQEVEQIRASHELAHQFNLPIPAGESDAELDARVRDNRHFFYCATYCGITKRAQEYRDARSKDMEQLTTLVSSSVQQAKNLFSTTAVVTATPGASTAVRAAVPVINGGQAVSVAAVAGAPAAASAAANNSGSVASVAIGAAATAGNVLDYSAIGRKLSGVKLASAVPAGTTSSSTQSSTASLRSSAGTASTTEAAATASASASVNGAGGLLAHGERVPLPSQSVTADTANADDRGGEIILQRDADLFRLVSIRYERIGREHQNAESTRR